MRNAVFPFLTIPDEFVTSFPWRVKLSNEEEWMDAPDFLEHWDNGTDLALSRRIGLDMARAAEALKVPADQLHIEVVVTAGTGAGRLPTDRWIVFRKTLTAEKCEAVVEFGLPGQSLAGALHLRTDFVLATPEPADRSPISPRRNGDIVWQDARRIRLEGDVSQFPITATDLGAVLGDEWKDALWYLQVDWEDMAASFDSAVRLLVNGKCEEFIGRFRKGDATTLQSVMADVMAQIARGWLLRTSDPDVSEGEKDLSSLAAAAEHWVVLAFGSAEAARRLLSSDPGRFHARFNALAAQTPEEDQ